MNLFSIGEEAEVGVVVKIGIAEGKVGIALQNDRDQEVHPEIDTAKDQDVHQVQINAERMKRLTKVQTRKIKARRMKRVRKKIQFPKLRPKVKMRKTRC